MITLYPFQDTLINDVLKELVTYDNVLAVAPTGSGKSVMIGFLAKKLPGRTLILTHRIEILNQNSQWVEGVGILTARKNTVGVRTTVVISMAQTLYARIKKHGVDYVGQFDNIIVDEIHVDFFKKIYSMIRFKKMIAFTGTPVLNKRETKMIEGIPFTRQKTLSADFDVIVTSVNEELLIEQGYLCRDFNVALATPGLEKLVDSEATPDGYTNQSQTEVFASSAVLELVYESYVKYGYGKKTMIFNPNTKVNLEVYNYFKKKEVNCILFDSVNKSDKKRHEVTDWFEKHDDGVLINCGVFTTGFDSKEVELIVMNRATKSLALFLQIVGRGSRTSTKIFKETFTVCDLGDNISRLGRWSTPRNWEDYFNPQEWKRKKQVDLVQTWLCQKCESLTPVGEVLTSDGTFVCCSCGEPKPPSTINTDKHGGKLVVIDKPPLPKAKAIIDYTELKGENGNFAFRILERQVVDLFVKYEVSKELYIRKEQAFKERVRRIYIPIYFAIIKSDLGGANKKLETQVSKLLIKIDKLYK